ncbi:DUF47 domain-containing protein [Stygiolobus caldivivus]|uniref:Phosphate transport regulator n=1 Tax=Stygiolobus caldivivus TaxID=2824673 RepID=A0A8D5U808_9CREN|nr:DUF47 family protein [Stygiolobus caldivivus]BCU70449.1 phosphate transport regulator [Stygiolobus caldivivus]
MIKFKLNKEEELFSKLVKMGEDLKTACDSLKQLFIGALNNEDDMINSSLIKIKSITERIAMSREETLSIIYGGAFLPDFKEAMVMLTQSLYQTSSAIKDSGRAISSRKPAEKCLVSMRESILAYLSTINEASERLVEMLSKLSSDINEALKVGKEIQMLERSGDELKDMLISKLYSMEKDIDLITILQMRDVIFFLDDILDFMEDATLSIEVLYATLKS